MVVVGVDVHKRSHTFVAVDGVGRKLGELTVAANEDGHDKAIRWAVREFGPDLKWGVEDCRAMASRLERDLLRAGHAVVRVTPRLSAQQRRTVRDRGKSDPIDALAVARVVLAEPGLPVATHDGQARELKLLVDRRDRLVQRRTATINQLRWYLLAVDTDLDPSRSALTHAKGQHLLMAALTGRDGIDARFAREDLAEVIRLTVAIAALAAEITPLVQAAAPNLLAIPGCGALSAAKIVGETAGVARFRSEACFAMHAGVAPIPVWSGRTAGRVRLCKYGNRQLNAALHRIAITQARLDSPGKVYIDKRVKENKTKTEAIRCLKRRLARVVFNALRTELT